MRLIFGHANNIAANTVFIYVENPNGQYAADVLDNALYAVYQAGGWVDQEEEKVQAVFCCTTPTRAKALEKFFLALFLFSIDGYDDLALAASHIEINMNDLLPGANNQLIVSDWDCDVWTKKSCLEV